MWRKVISLALACLSVQDVTTSITMELRVPGHLAEGSEAILGCHFQMEDDVLYSVKWYKDNREFFRYLPRRHPSAKHFKTQGVTVDMSRSSSDVVTLVDLDVTSAGVYKCEVSGEAPLFATASDQKYISVYLLPESPPVITGQLNRYSVGDRAVLNCSTPGSRPESLLKWFWNGHPVPRKHLQGPWYRMSISRPDAVETILQTRFTVKPEHFKDGVFKLMCQATIPPLYHEEAYHVVTLDVEQVPRDPVMEEKALMSLHKVYLEENSTDYNFQFNYSPPLLHFVNSALLIGTCIVVIAFYL